MAGGQTNFFLIKRQTQDQQQQQSEDKEEDMRNVQDDLYLLIAQDNNNNNTISKPMPNLYTDATTKNSNSTTDNQQEINPTKLMIHRNVHMKYWNIVCSSNLGHSPQIIQLNQPWELAPIEETNKLYANSIFYITPGLLCNPYNCCSDWI